MTVAQRWRERRDRYRPADDVRFDPRPHDVAPIGAAVAKAFVIRHHYSGTFPAARWSFGLLRCDVLAGVCVFSVPASQRVGPRTFGGTPAESVELGRFVLLDEVERNGESWFLARCLAELRRKGVRGVVSFSDPVARATSGGAVVFPGHLGIIYQASNAIYLGRTRPDVLRLLPDGSALPRRSISKVRNGERSAAAVVRRLEAAGAPSAPSARASWPAWLDVALAAVTRPLRHGGNHRYAFPLDRTVRRDVERGRFAYPKAAG